MKLSLKNKTLLLVLPLLWFLSGLIAHEAITVGRSAIKSEIMKKAETIVVLATKGAILPIMAGSSRMLQDSADSLVTDNQIDFVSFFDRNHNLIAHAGTIRPMQHKEHAANKVTYEENDTTYIYHSPISDISEKDEIDLFYDTNRKTSKVVGHVEIGISKKPIKEAEQRIVSKATFIAVAFSIIASLILYIMISITMTPITELTTAVNLLKKGEFPKIKLRNSKDEIGQLSEAFNDMSNTIRDRETRLIQSENTIKELFERVEHAIFKFDLKGDLIQSNRKFIEICGEVGNFADIFEDDEWGKIQLTDTKNVDKTIIGAGGNKLTVTMSIYQTTDESGEVTGFDGYLVDVSEKKKLEEALVQSQKMESIGLLAGGIAHDFNNILTGILGYTALLKEEVGPYKQQKKIEAIESAAMRATNITQQLLGFARKENAEVTKININKVISELTGFLRETIDKNIVVVLHTDSICLTVEGDSTQLYQAVMNLCINARDAMPQGGRLYIKTETCRFEKERVMDYQKIPPGHYVTITVNDTGSGMDLETKKKMFEPFFTTKEQGKGTGLGLSMSYSIIKNHYGYISVYSEPGLGTNITVYLPSANGTAKLIKHDNNRVQEQKGTILVVEDESMIRELARSALESGGYSVTTAENGQDAIEMFKIMGKDIDLVILDVIMPVIGGKKVFDTMKSISPETKIMICSGIGNEEQYRVTIGPDIAGFMGKPFRHNELVSKAAEILSNKTV